MAAVAYSALTCRARDTMALVERLQELGLDGWTPRFRRRRRLPRSKKTVVELRPILPGFVFLPLHHTRQALKAAEAYETPPLALFRPSTGHRPISESELAPLRALDLQPEQRADPFPPGTAVRIAEGPFGGWRGRVIEVRGGYVVVNFSEQFPDVKVAACLLRAEQA